MKKLTFSFFLAMFLTAGTFVPAAQAQGVTSQDLFVQVEALKVKWQRI